MYIFELESNYVYTNLTFFWRIRNWGVSIRLYLISIQVPQRSSSVSELGLEKIICSLLNWDFTFPIFVIKSMVLSLNLCLQTRPICQMEILQSSYRACGIAIPIESHNSLLCVEVWPHLVRINMYNHLHICHTYLTYNCVITRVFLSQLLLLQLHLNTDRSC